ncbi:MAG: DUF3592 domain-containing protein [Actinomycetota bacterium]|jgi:hypothetical protein|nr:DUF3592 domain-containing protein [Actinomycetota bacterium]
MTAALTGTRDLSRRRRQASWVLLAVAGVLTGLVVLALAGAALDDAEVDARTGHATAQVLAVTPTRTLVQFATPDGRVYSPEEGLAYPSGLQVGQLVRVEYDSADPEQVRVAGRTWTTGVVPAVITLVVLWVLVAPVAWWLRRRVGSG